MKYKYITIFLLSTLSLLACSSNDDDQSPNGCDFRTVISLSQYENAPSDDVHINSLTIDNNCLKINFSASGCDGNSWELKLIDSEAILESNLLNETSSYP